MSSDIAKTHPGPLAGLRVLDLTSYLAQHCARALGDMGADVIKVEPPDGDPARMLPPFAGNIEHPERSLRFIHANRSKRGVTLNINDESDREAISKLAARADILVEDFKPGYMASVGLGYEDLKGVNPNLVYVSITPFGQTGPHATFEGGDLIAQASAGMMFANGDDTRPPVMAPFEMVTQLACMHAAYGAVLAIRARRVIGYGQHVDVSQQEASLWAQHSYISRYSYINQITRREGHHSAFGAVNTYHTRDDGYVNLSIYMRRHFGRMATELMGNHPVLSDEMWWEREVRQENREVIDQFVQEYMETVDRDDVSERGQAIGMPIVPVLTPAEFADSAHAREREFFVEMEHPVIGSYKTAGPPLKFSKTPWQPSRTAPLLGEHTDEVLQELETAPVPAGATSNGATAPSGVKPLDGIRVVDFTRAFAGPLATMFLGFFGAEVIKIESEDLDDNRTPGQTTFQDLNRAKISATVDMRTPEGQQLIRELAAKSDAVIENFRPTVMDRQNVGYEELIKVKPDIIMLAMPGMGNSGPLSTYFCYGQQIMGVSGITNLWGHPDAPMDTRIKMPFPDYIAGIFGALSVAAALEYRDRTGEGQYIELAQVEGGAHLLTVAYMDYMINGHNPPPAGNRSEFYAPHGVYPCIGFDEWCAIEVRTEEQWQAFVAAMGSPGWASDERFATMQDRIANKEELDTNISEWTRQYTPRVVMRILQQAGVPATYVANGETLYVDPHLRSRPAAIVAAEHADAGVMEHQGIDTNLSDTPGNAGQPCPTKGQQNDYVFNEVLALPSERKAELEERGVLR